LKHFASPAFWKCYDLLPEQIREHADHYFQILKTNPYHPSLHFKKIGKYRSARIGISYRALAIEVHDGLLWFWIGTHSEYDKLVG
jgi:hypothetical protein